jgi:RNA polymerase sigma factor (sigma-70 family)
MTSTQSTTFWQNAYQQYAPKLLGVCLRYVAERNVAEDLMHDAFVTAIRKQDTYQQKGSFEGWLSRIAVNTALMYLRKEKKWMQVVEPNEISDATDAEIEEQTDPKSVILGSDFDEEILLWAIHQLPIHHQTVFNLYVFDDFSHQQISETLSISVGTSKSHLARARKKLQAILLEKALEMKKKERKIAFLPFLTPKEDAHFIDHLYKEKLGALPVTPKPLPRELQQLLRTTTAPTLKPTTWFGLSQTIVIVTSGVLVVGLFAWMYNATPTPKETSKVAVLIENQRISINEDTVQAIQNNTLTSTTSFVPSKGDLTIVLAPSSIEKKKNNAIQNSVKQRKEKILTTTEIPEIVQKQTIILKKQVLKKDTIFQ